MWKLISRQHFVVVALVGLLCCGTSAIAGPSAPKIDPDAIVSTTPGLITPAASRLCGRGLSGRCTKGRAACTHGSETACAKWRTWSEACTNCAAAFAKCRSNPKKSCESCIAAHDACEAKAR
jgi:hypothetical protein